MRPALATAMAPHLLIIIMAPHLLGHPDLPIAPSTLWHSPHHLWHSPHHLRHSPFTSGVAPSPMARDRCIAYSIAHGPWPMAYSMADGCGRRPWWLSVRAWLPPALVPQSLVRRQRRRQLGHTLHRALRRGSALQEGRVLREIAPHRHLNSLQQVRRPRNARLWWYMVMAAHEMLACGGL